MNNFEEFWEANKDTYIAQAKKDFERLQQGKFYASITIDTDDDFTLDIGQQFEIFGNTKKELVANLVEKLKGAKFTYCKTWGCTDKDGKTVSGDYSSNWYEIRDEAVSRLKAGYKDFSFGGNQTISVNIGEQKELTVKTKKKIF